MSNAENPKPLSSSAKPRHPWWVEFNGRASACIEAHTREDALVEAAKHGTPTKATILPYPREPRLGEKTDCPSFCYARNVNDCVGKTACPQRYSCTE